MKYLNSTVLSWSRSIVILTTLLLVITTSNFSYAQCSLACNGSTQVSLDVECEAEITPEMILNDQNTSCPAGEFIVEVYTQYNDIPTSPVVTGYYMGQTIIAEVIDTISGNSCWGYITIEDKLGPIIDFCPTDPIEVACSDLSAYEGPTFIDACEGPVEPILISETITPLSCDDDYIKEITRVYTAVDSKGYYAPQCTITYLLLRIEFDDVICPDNYTIYDDNALSCDGTWKPGQDPGVYDTDTDGDGILDKDMFWDDNGNDYPDPEEVGVPVIVLNNTVIPTSGDYLALYPYPDIYCNSAVTYDDFELPQVGCSRKIMRSWILREWHCNGEVTDTCLQIIEIFDDEAPEVVCPPSIKVTTNTLTGPTNSHYGDVTCGATIQLPLPGATDNCSSLISYDLDYPGGFEKYYDGTTPITLSMGYNNVIYTVYDECYNSTTCELVVEVVDNTPPVAVCDQYTVVSLTTGGQAKVNATSFDDGSYDDCKDHCMLVRRMDNAGCECNIPTFCNLDYLGEYNGSYYYLSDYKITADIAKSRAAAYGGTLAIFDSYYEESWVIGEARKHNYDGEFWIGMKSFGAGWLWDDHSPVAYNNWGPGQPTYNPGEECVFVNDDDYWQNTVCHNEQYYILEIKDICGFSETATFCCSDVGNDNMVVFRVVDVFGNYNDCMVNVDVQDKLAPTIVCPPHQTVNCDLAYNLDDLSQFGEATVLDDCGATVSDTIEGGLNQCNIGQIVRVFIATDNGGRTSQCKQTLTFEKYDNGYDLGDLVICPRDTTIFGCDAPEDLGPDVLGYPGLPVDNCSLVGADWDDEVFTFNNFNGDACFKILRHWEIIDWCEQDPKTGLFPVYPCQQVIKISNSVRPEFTMACDTIDVCTYDSDCSNGFVELVMTGSDDCTEAENLRWRYRIFAGELGVGPYSLNGTPFVEYSGVGDSINASGTYPVGTHVIQWTFYDKCGNAATCNQTFSITNCKAPTAYCISGLAVDLMPIDSDNDGDIDFGMIELWASDFDAGSFHTCPFYEVHLSFSPDTSERNKVYTCDDRLLEADENGNVEVEIWATVVDQAGNLIQSYCETYINIQDNMNACVGQSDVRVDVDGIIYTEDLETVEAIDVSLEGSELDYITEQDGSYAFPNMPTGGDYVIDPYSNTAPLNGVSTLDILEIQKHSLGIERLTSPYKIIAADINNDNELTSVDLIELRKLILGIYNELPNNDSWRFVDKGYVFQDPLSPLEESFTEDYEIVNLTTDMHVDFIAVKIGDVNGTAEIRSGENVEERSSGTMNMTYEAGMLTEGDIVRIPVMMTSEAISGYQFDLTYDNNAIEVLDIKGVDNDFNATNFNKTSVNNIAISYHNTIPVEQGTVLFEIVARAKTTAQAEDILNIGNTVVNAEAYAQKQILQPAIANVGVAVEAIPSTFALNQNTPNPFQSMTQVDFVLEQDEFATINVHDVHGKLIAEFNGQYNKGLNTIQINAKELGATGVLYLTLQTETNTASIKMVVIK